MIVDIQGDNSEFHNFYDKESNRRWIDVVNHLGHDGFREKVPDCKEMGADESPRVPVRLLRPGEDPCGRYTLIK